MMTDLTPTLLDFAQDDCHAGFRLQRLEVFNWGTFDRKVYSLDLGCDNALLTGEIGSGKSTLIDALTSLLVAPQRIAFNKAAGATNRERTLRSYVLGHYKSERSEHTNSAKPVALRDENAYSVVLAVFYNEGYCQTVSLAQVFWMKDPQAQPARFYAAQEECLGIANDFAGFGKSINDLRKKLRESGVEIFDSYTKYAAWFRRRLGIGHEQALELFHQTVSMKSVGNLTEFVREHMLEPFEIEQRIEALINHFEDLSRAHEAVLKAKRQMHLLQPLVNNCERYDELLTRIEHLRLCRDALTPFFSRAKLALLEQRLKQLQAQWARLDGDIERLSEHLRSCHSREMDLQRSIRENGGDRLERIKEEIERLESDRKRRMERADRYNELAKQLGLRPTDSHDVFISQHKEMQQEKESTKQRIADNENRRNEAGVQLMAIRREHQDFKEEIESLKLRRSNIDSRQVAIRAELCAALGIEEAAMPFVGELIRVHENQMEWEGAIERHLRGFGLSLLVTDEDYARVAEWVDQNRLRGRLVYFRVRNFDPVHIEGPQSNALAGKLDIKPDSSFYNWLEREITQRYGDMICCSTQEQFRREQFALSRAGQIKTHGKRHEKDDRFRLDDRSRYVLGWTNDAKIASLQENADQIQKKIVEIEARISGLDEKIEISRGRLGLVAKLEEFKEYSDIDWRPLVSSIERLREEKAELEASSDLLKSLEEQLTVARREHRETEKEVDQKKDKRSKIEQKREDIEAERRGLEAILDADAMELLSRCKTDLKSFREQALGEHQLTVESCNSSEKKMRDWLQARIDAEDKKIQRVREAILREMGRYHSEFPLEAREVDVSIEAAGEYRSMLKHLDSDDLPRFEAKFKELLNVNTINEVANFQAQLAREREIIRERIEHINLSMARIDYNAGRYIQLEAQPTQDADVRDFQSELRACTENVLTGSEDDQYSEAKFLQVKRIIERFRGREKSADQDARWTAKVTDVRNWFIFAASEKWREDDTEYEHYSDSGGKSGGQKAKLAYTVLAASLAYQFGLEPGQTRSRSFRLVVIDEAFGRGSDESAQYGLQLFTSLNLQLLIVTPLQKIHIIEPFVASVGFVHNEDGRSSKIRNLSIEQYREEKAGEEA